MAVVVENDADGVIFVKFAGHDDVSLAVPSVPDAKRPAARVPAAKCDSHKPTLVLGDAGADGNRFIGKLIRQSRVVRVIVEESDVISDSRTELIPRQDAESADGIILLKPERIARWVGAAALEGIVIG